MNQENVILKSFKEFIISNRLVEEDSIEYLIDDVVGSYIVNIIKQFYSDKENQINFLDDQEEQDSDLDNFIDVIDGYISEFSQMKKKVICEWLLNLKHQIDDMMAEETSSLKDIYEPRENFSIVNSEKTEQLETESEIGLLSEMFPNIKIKEIKDALKISQNDKTKAIENLLMHQKKIVTKEENRFDDISVEEKKKLKEKTLQKFGLVRVNEDGSPIEAKPRFVWNEEKKLCRYYENKIVSTKGEKLFEYKTEKDEELEKEMKKTYINLKPARKYRFH